MNQAEIQALDFRKPLEGSFDASNWPSDAQFKLGSETKDGFKITGLHETVVGYWYHVEAVVPGAVVPDEDTPGLMHQDLVVPKDSPRVCNDDKISQPFNFQKLGQDTGEQTPETEVSL